MRATARNQHNNGLLAHPQCCALISLNPTQPNPNNHSTSRHRKVRERKRESSQSHYYIFYYIIEAFEKREESEIYLHFLFLPP